MLLSTSLFAQEEAVSVYDYNAAFGHGFYTKNGTATRSASGKPGHAYWQNSADYKINISLNEEAKFFSGSETFFIGPLYNSVILESSVVQFSEVLLLDSLIDVKTTNL